MNAAPTGYSRWCLVNFFIGPHHFPRRLILPIQLVLGPTHRILANIPTNLLQSSLRANNRIVIVILPCKPWLAFRMTDVVGGRRLKRTDDLPESCSGARV